MHVKGGADEVSKKGSTRSKRKVEDNPGVINQNIVNVLQNLTKFVPSLVVQKLISDAHDPAEAKKPPPQLQKMETVVIFADISGYTNLSENCAKAGRLGNEKLAFCINRYMEDMAVCLNQYGGDIIKFIGDAMIVMWPPI